MALATKLSIEQIEIGIANFFNFRQNLIVTNVSWGLLNHEADIIVMSKSGYLTEVEIKRSWSDFIADFHKKHKHDSSLVSFRYYAVPHDIVERCKNKLEELEMSSWGLLEYVEDYDGECHVSLVYYPSNINKHDKTKQLSNSDQYQLARLGAMRIWSLKRIIIRQNDCCKKNCGIGY